MTERTSRAEAEAMLRRLDATGIEDEYLFVERRIYRDYVALLDELAEREAEIRRLEDAVTASEEYFIAIARSEANFDQTEAEAAFRRYNEALNTREEQQCH